MQAQLAWFCIVICWSLVAAFADAHERARFETAPALGYSAFALGLSGLALIVPREGLIMLCCILGAPLAAIGALLVASGVSAGFFSRRKTDKACPHAERQAPAQ